MTFTEVVKNILQTATKSLTPQEIRELIKDKHPQYYATNSHKTNLSKGHYKDLDHALLAQIYSLVRMNNSISCDTSVKPMVVSLAIEGFTQCVRPKQSLSISGTNNEDELVAEIGYFYKKSLTVLKDFGGPSIYFHTQAIKEQENHFFSDRHIEMIYATLASWGMHKMGDPNITKAKMVSFVEFKHSILIHQKDFEKLREYRIDSCTYQEYDNYLNQLEKIYYNLRVSISDATIVANSKTMAHILPNIIPPLDRQYSIRFFTQEYKRFFTKSGTYKPVNIPKNITDQFSDFKDYCCRIKMIFDRCNHEIFTIDKESFNTSYPKIMDNLIMAFVKNVPKPMK